MSKKQRQEILKAMMFAADLMPCFEDDYWGNFNMEAMGRFFEGIVRYFGVDRDGWYFHYNNLEHMDCPSHALEFISTNLPAWIEQAND